MTIDPMMEEEDLNRVVKDIEDSAYLEGISKAVHYLVFNGYIKYGFGEEYLIEQIEKEQKE